MMIVSSGKGVCPQKLEGKCKELSILVQHCEQLVLKDGVLYRRCWFKINRSPLCSPIGHKSFESLSINSLVTFPYGKRNICFQCKA